MGSVGTFIVLLQHPAGRLSHYFNEILMLSSLSWVVAVERAARRLAALVGPGLARCDWSNRFSMAFLGWLFIRQLFATWQPADQIDSYIAAAAPCTATVFVWSPLTNGDPLFTLSQIALNDNAAHLHVLRGSATMQISTNAQLLHLASTTIGKVMIIPSGL
jgi:hypothetical protein